MFKGHPHYDARSAGTSPSARIKVTVCHLEWADQIFCMERKHAEQLQVQFPNEMDGRKPIILRISDDYQFMDPELISLLRSELAGHLHL